MSNCVMWHELFAFNEWSAKSTTQFNFLREEKKILKPTPFLFSFWNIFVYTKTSLTKQIIWSLGNFYGIYSVRRIIIFEILLSKTSTKNSKIWYFILRTEMIARRRRTKQTTQWYMLWQETAKTEVRMKIGFVYQNLRQYY